MKKYLKVNEITDREEIIEVEDINEFFKEKNYKVVGTSADTYWVCDMNSLIGTNYSITEL